MNMKPCRKKIRYGFSFPKTARRAGAYDPTHTATVIIIQTVNI